MRKTPRHTHWTTRQKISLAQQRRWGRDTLWFRKLLGRAMLLTLLVGIVSVLVNGSDTLLARTAITIQNKKAVARTYNPLDKLLPELWPVCSCESSYDGQSTPQHYEQNGKTVRWGRGDSRDKGYCQINLAYHQRNAEAMEIDLMTPEGNIAYANYLFRRDGYAPWIASKSCWK